MAAKAKKSILESKKAALAADFLAATDKPAINPKYACFKLEIRPSTIHRWGIYTLEHIPPRRKIIEYTGEKISRQETKRRDGRPLHYLFTLDKYWTIDGAIGGSGAEYINHCCNPNLRATIIRGHILYFSLREVQAGEELTLDYHFPKDVERVPCKCGAANCRGWINVK